MSHCDDVHSNITLITKINLEGCSNHIINSACSNHINYSKLIVLNFKPNKQTLNLEHRLI